MLNYKYKMLNLILLNPRLKWYLNRFKSILHEIPCIILLLFSYRYHRDIKMNDNYFDALCNGVLICDVTTS